MPLTTNDHDLKIDSPWSMGERSGLLLLVFLVPAILVLDFVSDRGFSLQIFYLVPVALAAWSLGGRTGYAIAAAAGVSCAFVTVASRTPNTTAASLAWNVGTTFALFLFVAFVVARHRGFVDALVALARIDSESGALSRREFDRVFESEVRRARRYRRPVAMILIDASGVKDGGAKGKGYIASAVQAIGSHVREDDCVGRFGSRRLAVLLVECPPVEAIGIAGRLREALVEDPRLKKGTLAIGVATYGGKSPTVAADLTALAESQMQLAKGGAGLSESRID